ncbi:MAG TPA: hypothetical protein VN922_24745 [Bacteroidia bacterium]|nr:hypothetical protein [Bacteroidia bacterium]
MKTQEFLDKLSSVSLDQPKNRIFVERGIQLIEWEGNISPEDKNRIENLKASLDKANSIEELKPQAR